MRKVTLLILLLVTGFAQAQPATNVPTRGRRFWTGFMQNGFGAQSLKVHILSTTATSGTVSMPLNAWSQNFTVAANGVTVIDVPLSGENTGSGIVAGRGILIQSNDSINVFTSTYQNYTFESGQVLPESSLGNSYRVDSYHGIPNYGNLHKSQLLVVATQDGTQVSITPSVNTMGGNTAGVPFLVNLNAGQSYQLQAATDALDLTGSLVVATAQSGTCRPFLVIGGSGCASVPGACNACDVIFEQLIPTNAWGTRYFTVPINGVTSSTYRVLAHTNSTSVSIGGSAPILLNAGQTYEVNGTTTPVCVQANNPVSVAQLMEGYSCAGNGDPSLLLVSPADRLSTRASFTTPTSSQISQHSISVVVPLAAVGQLTLDGNAVAPALFQAYAGCNDRKYVKLNVPAGVHHLQANAGFQAYQFGVGYGESYATSVNDIRAIPVPQDSIVCGGGPLTLNAPVPLDNAIWTIEGESTTILATGNSYSFTPTASHSYIVSGTLPASGCPRSFTYHVGIPLTIPTLLTANGSNTINVCQYEPVQLALVPPPDTAWFNVQWSPAGSLNNPNIPGPLASPMTSTWYRVQVISPSGCGNLDDSIRVNVIPGKILDLTTTATPATVCAGSSIQLQSTALRVITSDDLNGPPNTMWTATQGGTISTACGSQSGGALYFNGNGQRYAQTVALNTIGGGEIRCRLKIAQGTAPCDDVEPGEDVVLEYSVNNGLAWNSMATYNENGYPGFVAVQTSIPAAAQGANVMFRYRQLANNGAGQDNWALDDVLVARYDNTWLSYAWTGPGTVGNPTSASTAATPTGSGWFKLNATDPTAGCTYRDSVHVQVNPTFNLTMTPNSTICIPGPVQLTATPGSGNGITYVWAPDPTLSATNIQSPIATPNTTTTYSVTATNTTGCSTTGQVTITVGQLSALTVTATNDTLCPGQNTQLTATPTGIGPFTYAWTGAGLSNNTVANPIASPNQTTAYSCTVTHTGSGCTHSQTITVVVTTGYNANAGADQTLCATTGHQLSVQHNVPNPSYQWTPGTNLSGATTQTPTITTNGSNTYSVVITDPNGCSVTDQVTITQAFAGLTTQIDASACADTPPTLTAPTTGASYLWNTGATSVSIVPVVPGPHSVTITNAQGCTGTTNFNVNLFPLPVVDLGPDIMICGAVGQLLNAGNASSNYLWNTGETTQQLSVSNSGTYSVEVTNANGCTTSDVVHVQMNPLPVDQLQDVTTCASNAINLDAGNAGSTFLWNNSATSQSITPTTSGTYSVAVTTAQNCTATFDADVILIPTLVVQLGNDTTICQGNTLTVDAQNPGANFLWNTGATTPSIQVTEGGTYSVEVTNSACSATDAITITTQAAPQDQLENRTQCTGVPALLDAGNPGSTYLWNIGTTTRTLSVNTTGTYSVTVTDPSGCSATFDAEVLLLPPPNVHLGNDTVLCEGEVLIVDAGNAGATYAWVHGPTTRTISVRTSGTYRVTVSNGYCERSDDIVVVFNPTPARMAARQFHTCLGEDEEFVRLDAGNVGSRYSWSTGESSQVILAGAYGWYVVEVLNQFDCAARDSAQVIEYCPSAIFIPNAFTPNGDGTNDVFIPVGKNIASLHLYVFDRWGTQLFESDDPTVGWDGTFAGDIVKNDVYVWRLEYTFFTDKNGTLGQPQEQLGHIQVLR
ncbi:MAG: gliding motility-associated C-terminal domain-containing protein [Flavobacteriales bacterium]|nr:gliding motility-associated C-terminal domain-containing protein [Flavobacteriales bacterium]